MKIAIYHNLASAGATLAPYETARRLVGCHGLEIFLLATADHAFGDLRVLALGMSSHDFR